MQSYVPSFFVRAVAVLAVLASAVCAQDDVTDAAAAVGSSAAPAVAAPPASTAPAESRDRSKWAEVRVVAADFKGKVYPKRKLAFVGLKGGEKAEGTTDGQGKLTLWLPKGDTLSIRFETLTGPYECDRIFIPKSAGGGNINVEYEENNFELKGIFFETAKAALRKESEKELQNLLKGLKLNPQYRKIEIGGHTDDVGDNASNQKLSEARANAVRDWLLQRGIAPERVVAVGYGEASPKADNSTPAGRAQNRRTELTVLERSEEP